MNVATYILELLKILLSGPTVTGSIALVIIFKFESGIRDLIKRIAHIKFPGGELSAPNNLQKRRRDPKRFPLLHLKSSPCFPLL